MDLGSAVAAGIIALAIEALKNKASSDLND
jgi:hypothetical protein